jgi:hypothetical protein
MNIMNMKSSRLGMVLLGCSVLGYAGDACKDVKFQIKNLRPNTIRITKVEYFNAANGRTQSEGVANLDCASGATCTTSGDNLTDSEGEDLSSVVFFFNDRESDGGWSNNDMKTQKKSPITKKCAAGMTYKGSPTWTVNP